jgi:hypothetical protein
MVRRLARSMAPPRASLEGCPTPGHGASTIRNWASLMARIVRRLVRLEVRQEPRTAGHGLVAVDGVDLAAEDDDVAALVNLMLLQFLARWQHERDETRFVVGAEDFGVAGLNVERRNVPCIHEN